MSNFLLQQEGHKTTTSIPNCFIEKFMPTAAGEFVKIYIYLLKCVSENTSELSISKIADVFNNTEKDTVRALKYWEKHGLLKLTYDGNVITSLMVKTISENAEDSQTDEVTVSIEAPQAKAAPVVAAKSPKAEKIEHSRNEIADFSNREDTPELLYIIQKYLGRALSGSDINTIIYIHDTLKMQNELIIYLFEYCVSSGHKNMRYIEKTAINWTDQGIIDVNGAKLLTAVYNEQSYPVMKAFGLSGRKPSKQETEFINKWSLSYGFKTDLIVEAVNRTINTIHQPSFEYVDSILTRWKNSNVFTLEAVHEADDEFEKRTKRTAAKRQKKNSAEGSQFNNFSQREYDYDELESKLLGS